MTKAKKNGLAKKPPRPSEHVRDEVKKLVFDTHQELLHISKVEGAEKEVAAIGDILDKLEGCFEELNDSWDAVEAENMELEASNKEIEDKLTELENIAALTTEVGTMVGSLKYETNNLLDAELMDLFTECLAEIQPAIMLENLKTIKEFKTVM